MKRKRETEIMLTYLTLAGVQITAETKKAVEIGLKQIRKEKYAEHLKRR